MVEIRKKQKFSKPGTEGGNIPRAGGAHLARTTREDFSIPVNEHRRFFL